MRVCVCVCVICKTKGHNGSLEFCLTKPLSLFPSISPCVDNMVDQTKVETSEAKAIEMEKKVK